MMRDEQAVEARFRARFRRQDWIATAIDAVVSRLVPMSRKNSAAIAPPFRILLANAGHLGDLILATSVLRPLAETFPGCNIGVLTSSHGQVGIAGHPLVERVHVLDHWAAVRGQGSRLSKGLAYYLSARPAMVRELRAVNYDVAIDLHVWFPNSVPLFWLAGIPVRIGCDRFGFSSLLTHPQPFTYQTRHELRTMLEMLLPLGVSSERIDIARPWIPCPDKAVVAQTTARLSLCEPYAILHPGASTATRDWPVAKWIELARRFAGQGLTPVVTGAGSRDAAIAVEIKAAVPAVLDTVGLLSWGELAAILSGAVCVYSVETSVGHLASALGRPVVSIYGGMADPKRWAPVNAEVVSQPQSCSPCFNKAGCEHRKCLAEIPVDAVMTAGTVAQRRQGELRSVL